MKYFYLFLSLTTSSGFAQSVTVNPVFYILKCSFDESDGYRCSGGAGARKVVIPMDKCTDEDCMVGRWDQKIEINGYIFVAQLEIKEIKDSQNNYLYKFKVWMREQLEPTWTEFYGPLGSIKDFQEVGMLGSMMEKRNVAYIPRFKLYNAGLPADRVFEENITLKSTSQ